MGALFGVIGVLVGAGLAAAFGFWGTRRKELEQATVTAAILVNELTTIGPLLADTRSALTQHRLSSLGAFWQERRDTLVLYLKQPQFDALARTMELLRDCLVLDDEPGEDHVASLRAEIDSSLLWLQPRRDELRAAHQAFILTPLIRYLRSRPWRRDERTGVSAAD